MTNPAFLDATSHLQAMQSGQCTARQLVDIYAARIEAHNGTINAIVQMDLSRARNEADKCDAERAAGTLRGPLHGLPVTIKDAFSTADFITTGGAPEYADHLPTQDAEAVRRYRNAGAIIMGKTNVPYMSGDLQSFNDIYGTTNNPWNLERTPGGSSGGAAAALAAGLTALDLGSDIGGSIRTPASHCGLFGHKPTYGIVPVRGHIPAPPGIMQLADLSVAGPLARSARDLRLAFDVLVGADPVMTPGWQVQLPPPRGKALKDYKVALWLDDPFCSPSEEVKRLLSAAAEKLAQAGAQVDAAPQLPISLEESHNVYLPLLNAVIMQGMPPAVLAQFDKMHQQLAADDTSAAAHTARGASMRHREWLIYDELRLQIMAKWAAFYQDYDIVLTPQILRSAIAHDHRPFGDRDIDVDGVKRPYMDQLQWAGPALLGQLPSTMVPAGLTADGMPVGLQIMGPRGEDYTSLHFAELAEQVLGSFVPPPAFVD